MNDTPRYIHIRNWDRYQHPDVTRNRKHAAPWIKQFTEQLSNEDYMRLSYADRGLLESLRIQYALNRGAGIALGSSNHRAKTEQATTNLTRILGQRVTMPQLERLNHAGFIEISASKVASDLQATSLKKTPLEVDVERDTDIEGDEELQEQDSFPPSVANTATKNGRKEGDLQRINPKTELANITTATDWLDA